MSLARNQLHSKKDANSDILATDNIILLRPSDTPRGTFVYTFQDEDDDDETAIVSYADNDARMEYADKHPPVPIFDIARIDQSKFDSRCHAPITTTASKYLYSVVCASGDAGITELNASYQHQLSLRIDERNPSLNLDCFEYQPTCMDLTIPDPPVPTRGELNRFDNLFYYGTGVGNEREDDDEVPELDDDVSAEKLQSMHYKAVVGKFLTSRCFRLRIAVSNIKGIRLMAKPTAERRQPPENDNDIGAVLVLETTEPLGESSFAFRTVRSKRSDNADAFTLCSDWLPGDRTASKATRFYFYGSLKELKQTAAALAKLCPTLADMLKGKEEGTNSLASGVSVAYDSAPSHSTDDQSPNNNNPVEPPPPSSWNAAVANAREVFESILAREENPTTRMMLRMMVDPESVISINQDPNSSFEDILLSRLACQSVMDNHGYDGMLDHLDAAHERGDQDCAIM